MPIPRLQPGDHAGEVPSAAYIESFRYLHDREFVELSLYPGGPARPESSPRERATHDFPEYCWGTRGATGEFWIDNGSRTYFRKSTRGVIEIRPDGKPGRMLKRMPPN